MIAALACLFIGWSPVYGQEEDRDWQDVLTDIVQEAVADGTSSKRLGRIRDVDVVNRSASVFELEVVLQGIVEPDRVVLTAEVFDDKYDVVEGFETKHDPIPEGDGTVLLQLAYRGSEDVRSVGVKVNLVDYETKAVGHRRKCPLPWEWSGDGSGGFQSTGGSMADPAGLATRQGAGGTVEQREPQVVTLDPQPVEGTPAMEPINTNLVAAATQDRPQAIHSAAQPPPPTASASSSSNSGSSAPGKLRTGTSSSGKTSSSNTATVNKTAAAIASSNVVFATSLDLYAMAKNATWKSQRGTLPFNGKTSDNRGFVRALGTTALSNGRAYEKVLQTHPEWKDGGFISGSYKVVIPSGATRFEAKVGFLPKVSRSDGVRVTVMLRQGGKTHTLIRKTISPGDGIVALRATVPEGLRGKEVAIVLNVKTGKSSTQDWFVWSEPIIK